MIRPYPLPSHDRDDLTGQFMGTEQVRLELLPQGIPGKIFHRASLTISTVAEKCIQGPACLLENLRDRTGDRIIGGEVQQEGLHPFPPQTGHILLTPGRCKDPVPPFLESTGHTHPDPGRTAGNQYLSGHGNFSRSYEKICQLISGTGPSVHVYQNLGRGGKSLRVNGDRKRRTPAGGPFRKKNSPGPYGGHKGRGADKRP